MDSGTVQALRRYSKMLWSAAVANKRFTFFIVIQSAK